MKHLSMWLAVILLGALPLAAAAFDYGPNQPLLAADTPMSQLPGAQVQAVATGAMPKPGVIASTADDSGATATAPDTTTPHLLHPSVPATPSAARSHTAPDHGKAQPPPTSARPNPGPAQPAWQSLLPGSIQ